MDFDSMFRQKLRERQQASATIDDGEPRLRQTRERLVAQLRQCMDEILRDLESSAVFSAAFSKSPPFGPPVPPDVICKWSSSAADLCAFSVTGSAGSFQVSVTDPKVALDDVQDLILTITPPSGLASRLGCGQDYGADDPVWGRTDAMDPFIGRVRERLAEYLANVAMLPVAGRYLPGFQLRQ